MKKNLFLSTACLALCMGAINLSTGPAQAQQEMGSLVYYPVTEEEVNAHRHGWAVFLEYNLQREPCQHYQSPPPGFEMRGCDLYRTGSTVRTETRTETPPTKTVSETGSLYSTIYFDFDRSDIRPSEKVKIGHAAQEIKAYNPEKVTVSSYADTSGASDYNQELSERRARSVVEELSLYDIHAEVIDQDAYGETHLAVPTSDGVKMQENRRAVIDFKN
jgi:outer membrane protein OmpA-like peptidoglycan-associated protein